MNRIESGKQVLRETEHTLRKLLAAAATHGEYSALPVLTDWAQQVRGLIESDSGLAEQQKRPGATHTKAKSPKTVAKKKRSARYPRFIKDDGQLVKIGWSKRDRCEYEHKAPQSIVRVVVASLAQSGVHGKRFAMESVLPIKDLDGTPIPDYQPYLVLAWLRSTELIIQHGRLGYTVPPDIDLADAVESCWTNLASRSSVKSNPKR